VGLDARDAAVGIERPVLVRSAVARVGLDDRGRRGVLTGHVEAQRAGVDAQLARGSERPGLPCLTAAAGDVDAGPRCGAATDDIEATTRGGTDDPRSGRCRHRRQTREQPDQDESQDDDQTCAHLATRHRRPHQFPRPGSCPSGHATWWSERRPERREDSTVSGSRPGPHQHAGVRETPPARGRRRSVVRVRDVDRRGA